MPTRNIQALLKKIISKNTILLLSTAIVFLLIPKTKLYGTDWSNFSLSLNGGICNSIPDYKNIELIKTRQITLTKNYSMKCNFFVEALVHYKLSQKLYVSSGLNYNQNTFKITYELEDSDNYQVTGEFFNNYIQIPLSAQYALTNRLSITLGGYMGIQTNVFENKTTTYALELLDVVGSITSVKYSKYDLNDYGSIDLGLLTGLNYNVLSYKNFSFIVFSRLNYGLLSHDKSIDGYDEQWKNINLFSGIRIQYN